VSNPHAAKRDFTGSVLGLLVFLGGVALLLVTFKLAYDMFVVPPNEALSLKEGETLQLGPVASTVTGLLFRVFLLIVMGVLGSLIANRGVHMYTESRTIGRPKDEATKEPSET
jgi:hypothetical protein